MKQSQYLADGVLRSALSTDAGQLVAVIYEPADRPLSGAAAACVRYGINMGSWNQPFSEHVAEDRLRIACYAAVDTYWRFE